MIYEKDNAVFNFVSRCNLNNGRDSDFVGETSMKNIPIQKGIAIIDEIFKNKSRQSIIGIIITGFGLTTACVGIAILMYEPDDTGNTK